MATNTPNYNLKKPDPTDFIQVADLNGNFDIIDTKIKEVADAAQNNQKITQVETKANKVETDLTNHLADATPHQFTDGATKYEYGFKINQQKDGLIFVYEEVTS